MEYGTTRELKPVAICCETDSL
ncbi:protein of unknown function [Burkholderia multivorans]